MMSEITTKKKGELPNVYFPTDESGRVAMMGVIDNYLGEGKTQPKVERVAIPRKAVTTKGKKTIPVVESDKKDE